MSITYSECVSVALVIQHATRLRHIVYLWTATLYNISPHYLIKGKFLGGKNVTEHKLCVLIFCRTFVSNIFRSEKNWAKYDHKCAYIGVHAQYRYCCQTVMIQILP